MAIPLSNRRRWQFAAGVAFVACVYILLTGTEYAASVYASHVQLPALERIKSRIANLEAEEVS